VATGIEAEGMAVGSPGRPSLTAIEGGQSLRTPISGGGITASAGQHALALNARQQSLVDEPEAALRPAENLAPEPVTVRPVAPKVEVAAPAVPQPAPKRVFESVPVDEMEPAPQAAAPAPAMPRAPVAAAPAPKVEQEPVPQPEPEPQRPMAREDSFLAPPPAMPQRRREPEQKPEPQAAAALASGGHEQRRPSLFERMTGTGRAKESRQEVKERSEPAMSSAPKAPATRPAPEPQPEPSLVADASNRMEVSSVEDDVLDIPAFLRRQAN
jgi:cell division protein FtsZ